MNEEEYKNADDLHSGYERENCMKPTKEQIILEGYRGSMAHGVHLGEDSIDDIDLFGVFIPPAKNILGLNDWNIYEKIEGKYDYLYYSIYKYFKLLLEGNPNVISFLWNPKDKMISVSEYGKLILENRKLFVGKHIYKSFVGYAHGQMHRMFKNDLAKKVATEILRRKL